MNQETIPFHGWNNCLRFSNDAVEVLVTTDVGPRILSYKTPQGENVLKVMDDQLGGSGEPDWRIRGGHRLWVAPEDPILSYHLDNGPAVVREENGETLIESLQESGSHRIHKTLGILLANHGPRLTISHALRNDGNAPLTVAPWALTVMESGGLELIPQPPLGEHPRDLLPNRGMVLWPYTDLSDPRWTFGRRFWLLRHAADYPPTKIGLAHRERWIAYIVNDNLFIKAFDFQPNAVYPDGGCNFETFANSEILEIESLGALQTLEPGQTVRHTEDWYLFPLSEQIQIESEDALADWLEPFLAQTHLL